MNKKIVSADLATDEVIRLSSAIETPEVAEVLEPLWGSLQTYKAGSQIVREGDDYPAVILLIDGWLSVYKTLQDGDCQMIDLVLPFDIVQTASANSHLAAAGVEALSDVTIASLSLTAWEELLVDNPGLRKMEATLSRASRARISERMLRLGRGDAMARIAYAFLELWIRLHVIGRPGRSCFHLPMTQQKIGEFTGMTSVHVCRVIGRLENLGIISSDDHTNIVLLDVPGLAKLAEIDADDLREEIQTSIEIDINWSSLKQAKAS